jgi:hypothetical protein
MLSINVELHMCMVLPCCMYILMIGKSILFTLSKSIRCWALVIDENWTTTVKMDSVSGSPLSLSRNDLWLLSLCDTVQVVLLDAGLWALDALTDFQAYSNTMAIWNAELTDRIVCCQHQCCWSMLRNSDFNVDLEIRQKSQKLLKTGI